MELDLTNNRLLMVGAGGHCRSVLDSVDRKKYTDIAIVDLPDKIGQLVYGVPIVGSDENILELFHEGYTQAIIAIGSAGNCDKRVKLYQSLKKIGFSFPVIVDNTAIISNNGTTIDHGTFIGKGVIINTGVKVGLCSIINSGAVLDHDSEIGSFAHIAPGVSMSGTVSVGNGTHIGTGSVIIDSIKIGANTTIGAGSVVVRDIPDDVVAFGNPCKIRRQKEQLNECIDYC
jgi:sugar O-acyltransferase (sialic acid O-acetyltransferase NeuD family)